MIFYFSGTGNTRWVASEIAKAINEELFYIPDLIREGRSEFSLRDGERIGFCFPTHGWQVPRIVRDFIKRLKMNTKNHYCWAHAKLDDIVESCYPGYPFASDEARLECLFKLYEKMTAAK